MTASTPIRIVADPTPIDEFRRLLDLNQTERNRWLADKPEAKRRVLLAKLREYSALPKPERDSRLGVLQLRWYLAPLMAMPAARRSAQLASIPPSYRKLVEERLSEWDLLPPGLQKEVLDGETTRQYFVRLEASPAERKDILRLLPPANRKQLEAQLAQWEALSPAQRQQTSARFNRYFELTEEEQEKTLGVLSAGERRQMEQVLATFQGLSPQQRRVCIESFAKFANLTPAERDQFLKNAERWREISPAERQAWRDLVTALPPLPPGVEPSLGLPPMPGAAEK